MNRQSAPTRASISALRLVPDALRALVQPTHILRMLDRLAVSGDRVRIDKLTRPSMHFLFHPQDIKEVLCDNHKKIGIDPRQLETLTGKKGGRVYPTILTSSGKAWQEERRRLAKHMTVKKGFVYVGPEAISEVVRGHIRGWEGQDRISLAQESSRLMIKLTYKTLFNQSASQETCDTLGESIATIHAYQYKVALTKGALKPFLLNTPKVASAFDNFYKEVAAVREQYFKEKADNSSPILLDDLTHEDEGLMEERIAVMIRTSHTSMYTMFNALWNLAARPDYQERIAANDLNDPITRQVIKETLRLHPAIHITPKEVTADIEMEDGYLLKAKDMVVVSPYITNRREDSYDDPYSFNPEVNFSSEMESERHSNAFMSLGAGPHGCPGGEVGIQQVYGGLTEMCKQYKLAQLGGKPKIEANIMMHPDSETQLAIRPR